ncbi:hypothetical protein JCM3770_005265 [Rhodotorula araucariae]
MAYLPPSGADTRTLPPGWISELDPRTGVPYFVNTAAANPQAVWDDPRTGYYGDAAAGSYAQPASQASYAPSSSPYPPVGGAQQLQQQQGQGEAQAYYNTPGNIAGVQQGQGDDKGLLSSVIGNTSGAGYNQQQQQQSPSPSSGFGRSSLLAGAGGLGAGAIAYKLFDALKSLAPRPLLEGGRHNSSDDSVATLSSTTTTESDSSLSTLYSEPDAAELLNEPPRRSSDDWRIGAAVADALQSRMEGLGLRQHRPESRSPPLLRPSPPPRHARSALPGSAYAGLGTTSLATATPFSTCPAMSPSLSVFPQPSTSATVPDSAYTGMLRTGSASSGSPPRAHRISSPHTDAHPPRPMSADTFSTSSTRSSTGRPWVFDSDASSVCSATSCASNARAPAVSGSGEKRVMLTEDGREEVVEEGGDVYKPQGDYFLDDRPEPPGTMLEIDRSEPSQVIVRVRLPGFSLENITVAMRRGHKVHIVADSYGEAGGHYEKLVMLGSDISSAAPRAEFDGTLLRIIIQRRPSRPSIAVSVAPPAPVGVPYVFGGPASPASSVASSFSPDLSGARDHTRRPSVASSLASVWSTDSAAPALSPSLGAYAFRVPAPDGGDVDDPLPPPCTARAGPPPDQKRARCLIGPEGARAAAKAAREEAAKRAKEEIKNLPKEARGGRKLPFRRQKEDAPSASPMAESAPGGDAVGRSGSGDSNSSSSAISSSAPSGSCSPVTSDSSVCDGAAPAAAAVNRCGTVKAALATSPRRVPALSHHSSGGSTVTDGGGDETTSRALESAASQLSEHLARHPDAAAPASPSPTRPKFRASNLTLRPFDRAQSFVEAAAAAAAVDCASSPSASSDGGGTTPRREDRAMRFTPFS